MRWIIAAALWLSVSAALVAAPEGDALESETPAVEAPPATEFFPVRTDGVPTRIERDVIGVVAQELTLAAVRARGTVSEYRLTFRVRNPGRRAAHADLRLILWGEEKPIVAFDIRTADRGAMIPPRSGMRFISQFDLDRETPITRLSVVPLPPQTLVVRTDQPVPLAPQGDQPGPVGQPGPTAQEPPQGGEGQSLTPEQIRQQQEQWMRYQAEVARMYQPRIMIPNVNAWGNMTGIGPYGPQYGFGDGIYLNTPYGVVPMQSVPPVIHPYPMWGLPMR
ncbi:MAG: hypothetical protein HY321_02700 [Armatimonadetes bacterium]|nr:hypothetical protein [Armatimonadota bacterium]